MRGRNPFQFVVALLETVKIGFKPLSNWNEGYFQHTDSLSFTIQNFFIIW